MESKRLPDLNKNGYNPTYSSNESYRFVLTFTEVEEDAYKIKVEELLNDGRRVDLLHREILGIPSIIERTDLHLTKEAAQELWQWVQNSDKDLLDSLTLNSNGQRFVETVLYSKVVTTRVCQYLERIAESLHAQQKRQAIKAAKQAAKAAKEAAKAAKRQGGSLRKSGRVLRRKSRNGKH